MRKIKFRAWNGSRGKMIYDHIFINLHGRLFIDCDPHGVDMSNKTSIYPPVNENHYTLLQYTGLKDSSDPPKEIYEGDILKFTHIKGAKPFQIFWEENEARWTDYFPKTEVEIIGNIFENPELLDGKP